MNLVRINLFIALTVLVALNGCNSKQPRFRGSSDSGSKKDFVAVSEIQPAYVDKDYQFRIDPPSTKWRIYGDPESRSILPDAVAAGVRVGGTYGIVVVEPIEDTDLRSLATLIRDNLKFALPDAESDPAQEIVFEGFPAIKFTSTGSTNDTRFYYTHLLFVRQNFGFQLITWSAKPEQTGSQEFFDAFHLLDGDVQGRLMSTETPDFETVGQRVRDGIFESSVFRLTVNPPQGWRLLVGRELAQLDPDAIVGLAAADSTAYVILSPEYLPNDIPDSFLESQRGNFFTTLQDQFESISRSDTVEFNVCGKTVKFEHFVTSAPQFQYYCGVELFDDLKIMCSAWSLGSDSDQLRESVRAAVGSVSLIPQQDTDKLRQEELARTDIQSSIGRDFSLRRSVYRNFRTGVVWTRPKSFWKVNPGDAAKQVDPNCELFCENILAGIYLTVVSDELEDLTLDLNSHHSFVIENTFEEDHAVHDTVPQKLMIDGAAALVSEGDDDTDDIPIRYRIITTIRNGWAYQITVSGYTGRMEQYKREVDAAIAGFAFLGRSLKPVNMTPKGIDDLWLGLKLDLSPSSWKPRDVTPPQLRNLGRVVNFQRGNQVITLGAIMLPSGSDSDMKFIDSMMADMLKANFSRDEPAKPIVSVVRLGADNGISVKQQAWIIGKNSAYCLTGTRDSTVIFLLILDTSGHGSSLLESVKKGFRFLD